MNAVVVGLDVASGAHVGQREVAVAEAAESDGGGADATRPIALGRRILTRGRDGPCCWQAALSSAPSRSTIRRGAELAPIRPTRQIFPASGPRPAPISMLNSSSRCLRTAASSTPSERGTRTAFSVQSRSPSGGSTDKPSVFEPLDQGAVIALVPRPSRLEPFFLDDRQRFVERVDERRRHRVVILPPQPVVLEQLQVEVEAAARDAPLERPRPEDDRRQARRRAETFLRAAVARVDAPGADVERMPAERGDGVDDRQRAVLARDRRQLLDRIEHAGRRLGVHQRHDVGRRLRRARGAARRDRRRVPTRRRAA